MSSTQLRKEILSVGSQLERERELRLKHEAKIKELETQLYPSRLKQATVEAQQKIRAELMKQEGIESKGSVSTNQDKSSVTESKFVIDSNLLEKSKNETVTLAGGPQIINELQNTIMSISKSGANQKVDAQRLILNNMGTTIVTASTGGV